MRSMSKAIVLMGSIPLVSCSAYDRCIKEEHYYSIVGERIGSEKVDASHIFSFFVSIFLHHVFDHLRRELGF
ncbi:MAG: hypothetical protein P9X27_06725 [Candidatus Kaelpia aquatica]|nr:hypothetical protein [Candidatus Kaelpia aquatica]